MRRSQYVPYFFLTPAIITLLLFFFLPVLAALVMSTTDFDIYALVDFRRTRFVLLQNYLRIFSDPLFWKATSNTFYFVLVGGPLTMILALISAIALNSKLLRFKKFFRLAFFMPVITTLVAVAVVWRYLYHPRYGVINYILSFFGIEQIDWLGDPFWAMPALIILAAWKNFGYSMMIFLAGLQAIPEELYEATEIDGASRLQQHIHITIPQLAPTTIFITVITIVGYFQFFAEPYVMTQGGPLNSTLSIVLYLYDQGFRWWHMGYSSAIAFVLFFIMVSFAIIQNFLRKHQSGAL